VSPQGRQDQNFDCPLEPNPDVLLREGDVVVVEGLTVEVLEHGEFDRIVVSRVN
jgi:hypothetical protein